MPAPVKGVLTVPRCPAAGGHSTWLALRNTMQCQSRCLPPVGVGVCMSPDHRLWRLCVETCKFSFCLLCVALGLGVSWCWQHLSEALAMELQDTGMACIVCLVACTGLYMSLLFFFSSCGVHGCGVMHGAADNGRHCRVAMFARVGRGLFFRPQFKAAHIHWGPARPSVILWVCLPGQVLPSIILSCFLAAALGTACVVHQCTWHGGLGVGLDLLHTLMV